MEGLYHFTCTGMSCDEYELFLKYAPGIFQGATLRQVSTPMMALMGHRRRTIKADSELPSLPNNQKLLHHLDQSVNLSLKSKGQSWLKNCCIY